jgi:hypothetical protein
MKAVDPQDNPRRGERKLQLKLESHLTKRLQQKKKYPNQIRILQSGKAGRVRSGHSFH